MEKSLLGYCLLSSSFYSLLGTTYTSEVIDHECWLKLFSLVKSHPPYSSFLTFTYFTKEIEPCFWKQTCVSNHLWWEVYDCMWILQGSQKLTNALNQYFTRSFKVWDGESHLEIQIIWIIQIWKNIQINQNLNFQWSNWSESKIPKNSIAYLQNKRKRAGILKISCLFESEIQFAI